MPATLQATLTDEQMRRLAAFLAPHDFPDLAHALRQATHSILGQWRTQTMKVLPHLDGMTVKQFEDAIATILKAVAEAMETKDPMAVRSLLDKAPEHGFDRFLQEYDPYDLFTEERILRKVIVVELDAQMGRPATKEEATALHELLDIMSYFALLTLCRKRTAEARELAERASRNERLAALGTLALGLGHDLSNMLLPLRGRIEVLQTAPPAAEAADHLKVMEIIATGMNDLSTNLRALATDPDRSEQRHEAIDLGAWCPDFQKFFRPIIQGHFVITCDVPASLPPAPISRAALSQAMFNLLKNAAEALGDQPNGHIVLSARARSDGGVRLVVTDNGPGMPADVREHCFEPFYTTKQARGTKPGSGLGLAIVHALLTKAGATIEVHSPPPRDVLRHIPPDVADEIKAAEPRDTAFVIDLPPHQNVDTRRSRNVEMYRRTIHIAKGRS